VHIDRGDIDAARTALTAVVTAATRAQTTPTGTPFRSPISFPAQAPAEPTQRASSSPNSRPDTCRQRSRTWCSIESRSPDPNLDETMLRQPDFTNHPHTGTRILAHQTSLSKSVVSHRTGRITSSLVALGGMLAHAMVVQLRASGRRSLP